MRQSFSLIALALFVAACGTESTAPSSLTPDELRPSSNLSASASDIVIDDFTSGPGAWEACGHNTFVYHENSSIVGGSRELSMRDGHSCRLGGRARMRVDAAAPGLIEAYGGTAVEQVILYGTAIGRWDSPWSPSPNKAKAVPLNLQLTMDHAIRVDMLKVHTKWLRISLLAGNGIMYHHWAEIVKGTNLIPLSSFTNMTPAAAADIDGIIFYQPVHSGNTIGSGNIVDRLSIERAGDTTPPSITPSVVGTLGANGWYTSDVKVSWKVADGESTVSSTSGCDASAVSSDTGAASFTCKATSAGGTASETVTVKRDATAPALAFSGNQSTYTVDQTVAIGCSASDATSGLASSDCPAAKGDAYTFALGSNTLSATATDQAGNNAAASASFTVQVNAGSLCTLTKRWVDKAGVAHSLCKQLENNAIAAYQNHLRAQSGKSITPAHAEILLRLAAAL